MKTRKASATTEIFKKDFEKKSEISSRSERKLGIERNDFDQAEVRDEQSEELTRRKRTFLQRILRRDIRNKKGSRIGETGLSRPRCMSKDSYESSNYFSISHSDDVNTAESKTSSSYFCVDGLSDSSVDSSRSLSVLESLRAMTWEDFLIDVEDVSLAILSGDTNISEGSSEMCTEERKDLQTSTMDPRPDSEKKKEKRVRFWPSAREDDSLLSISEVKNRIDPPKQSFETVTTKKTAQKSRRWFRVNMMPAEERLSINDQTVVLEDTRNADIRASLEISCKNEPMNDIHYSSKSDEQVSQNQMTPKVGCNQLNDNGIIISTLSVHSCGKGIGVPCLPIDTTEEHTRWACVPSESLFQELCAFSNAFTPNQSPIQRVTKVKEKHELDLEEASARSHGNQTTCEIKPIALTIPPGTTSKETEEKEPWYLKTNDLACGTSKENSIKNIYSSTHLCGQAIESSFHLPIVAAKEISTLAWIPFQPLSQALCAFCNQQILSSDRKVACVIGSLSIDTGGCIHSSCEEKWNAHCEIRGRLIEQISLFARLKRKQAREIRKKIASKKEELHLSSKNAISREKRRGRLHGVSQKAKGSTSPLKMRQKRKLKRPLTLK